MLKQIMDELESVGNENTKKIFLKHGAKEPFFGVKVEDLKKIQKRVKKNYELSKELFNTGNSDAMYLAGLIAEPQKMTKAELEDWAHKAYWYMISEYTVAWVTSESKYAMELGLEWIDSDVERIATSGWSTLSSFISFKPDSEIDTELYRKLLIRVGNEIHGAKNRVRYSMNNFVISVGAYVPSLNQFALDIAEQIGSVSVDMGGTACKTPQATEYIRKVMDRGSLGKKRKGAGC
jgi:3-methyladenine DNA glycosylase AlkD